MKLFSTVLVLVALLAVVPAFSGVNLKNGNFYISYTDIVVPGGGKKLEITRTYNSKIADRGWFGVGWGSDFETFIKVSSDGAAIVHENGSGVRTRFVPSTPVDAVEGSKRIIEAMKKRTTLTAVTIKELEDKLSKDAELRHAYARKFKVEATLAKGSVLYSNVRGQQKLYVTDTGFKREYSDGKIEFFNKNGKMEKVTDKSGYSIDILYNKDDRIESIKDSQAKQLFFEWFPDGKVKAIWSAGDKKATYTYKGDDLIESKDVGAHSYKYGFDSNHNMTSITYQDNSQMKLAYDSKTQFVTDITDRNGEVTSYKYEANPKNPDMHYWTTVTKKGLDGKPVPNRYEYEIKARPDGSQYTYRILTIVNNSKTETIYNECCNLPVKIARGNLVTNFEYTKDGLLIKKTSSNGEFVNINYNDKWKKISKVVNNQGWTEFTYDERGNLSKAVNGQGKAVLLIYDNKGRITKMVDKDTAGKDAKTLSFQYNALGKPVEIAMDKVGKINVEYDNYGEIKKVESKAGHRMALQVTQAFQNLLQIVKPAGVNLSL